MRAGTRGDGHNPVS